MRKSKLGLHVNTGHDRILEFANAQPHVGMFLVPSCGKDFVHQFKARSPETLMFGRYVYPLAESIGHVKEKGPKEAAKEFASLLLQETEAYPFDAVTIINEMQPGESVEDAKMMNELQVELARLIHAAGKKTPAYNFSITRPHTPLWPYLLDGLSECDWLGLHGGGPVHNESNYSLFSKHHDYLEKYREDWAVIPGWARRPIIFTEFAAGPGWKRCMKAEQYEQEIIEVDQEVYGLDDYVHGFCIFCAGATFPWFKDDVVSILPQLTEYVHRVGSWRPEKEEPMENPIKIGIREDYHNYKSPVIEVKTMEMEDYLRQCVPYEVYPSWKPEALKAQAIAARTYAEWRKKHPKHEDMDICNSTCCQVMGPTIDPRTDKAVKDTEGILITRQGQIINAEYSANCGGKTESGISCQCWEISDHGKTRYGHGRGMCQWGAEERAQNGDTFEEILWHYYGSDVKIGGKEAPLPEPDPMLEANKELQAIKTAHQVMGERIKKLEGWIDKAALGS